MKRIYQEKIKNSLMTLSERSEFLKRLEKRVLQNKKSREKPKNERRTYGVTLMWRGLRVEK